MNKLILRIYLISLTGKGGSVGLQKGAEKPLRKYGLPAM